MPFDDLTPDAPAAPSAAPVPPVTPDSPDALDEPVAAPVSAGIRSITLTNFMAHEHTVLELGPGLTVLTGPNNTGKSAIVEALRCLTTNPAPKSCIRHGAKQARVEALLEDGARVAWVRKKTSAIYEVYAPGAEEPTVYAKFGRTPPEDVLDLLRLDPVALETSKDPVDVHLGDQREPIFLLKRSDADVAAFFAASSESAHLLAMQNALRGRVAEAKRRERDLAARLRDTEADLDRLAPLPELTLRAEAAHAQAEALERRQAALPPLAAALGRLEELRARADCAAGRVAALRPLAAPPVLAATAPLGRMIAAAHGLLARRAATRARRAALAPLAAPPELRSTRGLADLISSLSTIESQRKTVTARQERLQGLRESPTIRSSGPLTDLLARITRARAEAERRRARLDDLDQRLRALRRDIAARLDEIGACPLCGQHLDAAAFLPDDPDGPKKEAEA